MKKYFLFNSNEHVIIFTFLGIQCLFYGLYWRDFLSLEQFFVLELWLLSTYLLSYAAKYLTEQNLPLIKLTEKRIYNLFKSNDYYLYKKYGKTLVYRGLGGVIVCQASVLPGVLTGDWNSVQINFPFLKETSEEIDEIASDISKSLPNTPIYRLIIFHGSTLLQLDKVVQSDNFILMTLRDNWEFFFSRLNEFSTPEQRTNKNFSIKDGEYANS